VTQNVDSPSQPQFVDALADLRVVHGGHCRAELTEPWGVDTTACLGPSFHFVAEGACVLHDGAMPRALSAGDLVVFTRRGGRLTSAPDVADRFVLYLPTAASPHLRTLRHGGGGERALLLSGGAQFDPPDQPLVRVLPEVLVVRASEDAGTSVRATLDVMAIENAQPDAGDETVIARLCDILVIQAVRVWLRDGGDAGDGVRDEHFARAPALMHRQPECRWSVNALVAERLLATTDLTVAEVAQRVGFGSTAAFSRAFKRAHGRPPSTLRA
jgi:hypothetical protein